MTQGRARVRGLALTLLPDSQLEPSNTAAGTYSSTVCCMYCTYLPTLYTPPASQLLPTLPPPLQVTHLHPLFSKRIFFLLFSFVIFPTHASKPAPLSFPEAGSQFHQPTFRDNRHFTQSVLRFTPCGNSISVLPNYRMAKIRQAMFKGPTYIQVLM